MAGLVVTAAPSAEGKDARVRPGHDEACRVPGFTLLMPGIMAGLDPAILLPDDGAERMPGSSPGMMMLDARARDPGT